MGLVLSGLKSATIYEAPRTVKEDIVYESLKGAETFLLAVAKEEREPFRHVSVAIVLDGKPRFLISRRIRDKSVYAAAASVGSVAVTTIEEVTDQQELYLLPVWKTRNMKEAKSKLDIVLNDVVTKFIIWTTNCRHYARNTILRVMNNESWELVSKNSFLKFFEDLHRADVRRCFIIFICFFFFLFIFLCLLVISIVTSSSFSVRRFSKAPKKRNPHGIEDNFFCTEYHKRSYRLYSQQSIIESRLA